MLIERIRALRKWFVPPQSKYKIGDAVRLRGGGNELMVVIEVWSSRGMNEPLIHCHTPNATSESESFPESAIEPFDWDLAARNKRGVK